jgi:hypothetical protein
MHNWHWQNFQFTHLLQSFYSSSTSLRHMHDTSAPHPILHCAAVVQISSIQKNYMPDERERRRLKTVMLLYLLWCMTVTCMYMVQELGWAATVLSPLSYKWHAWQDNEFENLNSDLTYESFVFFQRGCDLTLCHYHSQLKRSQHVKQKTSKLSNLQNYQACISDHLVSIFHYSIPAKFWLSRI